MHPRDVIPLSTIYKNAADRIETAANIASGHGELGLANQLWAFEDTLRGKAREARLSENERYNKVLKKLSGEGGA